MSEKVAFKGTINGIILQFEPSLPFNELYQAIEEKLKQANNFFKGSHIIGVEGGTFTVEEEVKLERLFREQGGMKLLSLEKVDRIKSNKDIFKAKTNKASQVTKTKDNIAKEVKQKTQTKQETKPTATIEPKVPDTLGETIFHRGTLRSGNVLEATGHIVLLGDANAGSELIARGNILVMGALRGFAHAGSAGDEQAYIVAGKLEPTQLRIAGKITRPPDDSVGADYTEVASIKNGQIIIEPYK